jgi:hypothetical protein
MRCSPATKASSIASVAWYLASGPGAVSAIPSSSASGYGWSQVISPRRRAQRVEALVGRDAVQP